MPDSKPWYLSKTIWAGALTGLAGVYSTLAAAHGLPPIPAWISSLLGIAAIYGRVSATTTIG